MAPTGGAFAAETESGLAGFTAQIADFTDQVTQDYYGYPLCTTYKKNSAGQTIIPPAPCNMGSTRTAATRQKIVLVMFTPDR